MWCTMASVSGPWSWNLLWAWSDGYNPDSAAMGRIEIAVLRRVGVIKTAGCLPCKGSTSPR
jgi:hypothetical protein